MVVSCDVGGCQLCSTDLGGDERTPSTPNTVPNVSLLCVSWMGGLTKLSRSAHSSSRADYGKQKRSHKGNARRSEQHDVPTRGMGTRMKVERGASAKGEKKAAKRRKISVFKRTYSAPWGAVEPRITAFVSVPAVSDIAEKGASISHHSAPSRPCARFNIGIIDR